MSHEPSNEEASATTTTTTTAAHAAPQPQQTPVNGRRRVRVWAPRANDVAVVVDGRATDLARAEDGHHEGDVDGLVVGARYAFVLDGEGPFPDPRSRSQPEGVHGASEVVDVGGFAWRDAGFRPRPWREAVVYELHVGTFSEAGTFDGAIAHLDHLAQLGVTHVELMPIAAFDGDRGWGYDGVHLFAPHAAYGGALGLCRFVDACHQRGLAVVLDVVFNHLGPSGNYLPRFAPYFTDRHKTPWGDALNVDGADSDGVRRFVLDNVEMWLREHHIDGLRLDAVHAIVDQGAVPLVEEVTTLVHRLADALDKELVVIAESDLNDPRVVRPAADGGLGFDAQWSDDFHHALHRAVTGEASGYYADYDGLADVARALAGGYVFVGQHAPSRRRKHGRPFPFSGERLLGYAQTHDQVGNRARGERLATLAGDARARVALTLVLTSPFVPLLFAGEEWGAVSPFLYFIDHAPPLAAAVRVGRADEFAAFHAAEGADAPPLPDPQAPASFEESRLRWSDLARAPHRQTLDFVRSLIALRRERRELGCGALDDVRCTIERPRTLVVQRGGSTVVANLDDEEAVVHLPVASRLALASGDGVSCKGFVAIVPANVAAVFVPR